MTGEPSNPRPCSLILASASPRRRELLKEAGYEFVVHPADIDENAVPAGLLPMDIARLLAAEKAKAVAAQFPDDVVLAADTVVAFGDRALGKPADAEDARRMLDLLSGTTHIVISGVSVVCRPRNVDVTRIAMSAVHMRMLSREEIDAYVAGGQWQGKAGGYGIQDCDPFVTRIGGSHSNVVGLPMSLTRELLGMAGLVGSR